MVSEENIFELATKFAELVEKQPHRFSPTTKWWENINRREILNRLLDRAADRVVKKQNDGQALRAEAKDEEEKQNHRDFGSRLGIHIACYYWSGSFSEEKKGENKKFGLVDVRVLKIIPISDTFDHL